MEKYAKGWDETSLKQETLEYSIQRTKMIAKRGIGSMKN